MSGLVVRFATSTITRFNPAGETPNDGVLPCAGGRRRASCPVSSWSCVRLLASQRLPSCCRSRLLGGRVLLAGARGAGRPSLACAADTRGQRGHDRSGAQGALARIAEIRAFASRELALPDNPKLHAVHRSRPSVRRLEGIRDAGAVVVRAHWCFPVAGCVSYRGYFRKRTREAKRRVSSPQGDDVYVGSVPAYSTLGYFDDPVLSTFVRWPETEVARLIFHELAHQLLYVKDDTVFNESYAVTVEEAGLERWQAAQAGVPDAAQFAADAGADAAPAQRIPDPDPHDARPAGDAVRAAPVGRREARAARRRSSPRCAPTTSGSRRAGAAR